MKRLRACILLVILMALPALAANLPPGPLTLKAYLYWVHPIKGDQESYVQRVFMRLDNPTQQTAEIEKMVGVFTTPEGEELFVDQPPATPLAGGQGRDIYFRFANSMIRQDLSCRVVLRYKLGTQTFERKFVLSADHRGLPEGWQQQ